METLDNRTGAGQTSALVLDSGDMPRIAYWNSPVHPDYATLMMATKTEANWTFEVVDNETYGHLSIGLVLDDDELSRVSYLKEVNPQNRDLWFARLSENGSWELEMIDQTGDIAFPALSIDTQGHFHITYLRYAAETALMYAYHNGSAWYIERIGDQKGIYGAWSSTKIDNKGRPHIALCDYPRNMVSYATRNNGSWEITPIDNMHGPGLSLDLDSQMYPHISYQGFDANLRHAWWNGTAWQIEVVDNSHWVGEFPSMRIDENDNIHISYSRIDLENHTGYLIKYATTEDLPTGGIETTIDIDPDTLNLKSNGKFITAYIELEGADVRDIDASSILLNGIISPILDEKYGFVTSEDSYIVDHDENGVPERMVKFWRSEVQDILDVGLSISITVSGQLFDGTPFSGTDEIRVIDPERLTKPKISNLSPATPLAVLPETHGLMNVQILVHFTGLLDTDDDSHLRISPQVAEPASSIVLSRDERPQFWYRT